MGLIRFAQEHQRQLFIAAAAVALLILALRATFLATHPLIGKPAPGFVLPLVSGGTFDLEQHRGSVVLLDFWATWCPPCREGLPIIAQVAEEYAGRGVVTCAVNLQEESSLVREFLEMNRLGVPAAVDGTGRTVPLYKISGIPQTVIVAPDGTVERVYQGVSWNFENELRQVLDKMLAKRSME